MGFLIRIIKQLINFFRISKKDNEVLQSKREMGLIPNNDVDEDIEVIIIDEPVPRELLAIDGLEKTTDAFKRKLIMIADRNGLNPNYVSAVISFETGQTFSPTKRPIDPKTGKPLSSAIGLIQFLSGTAKMLGTSTQALSKMTATRQLDFVEKYYQFFIKDKPLESLENTYLVVLAGSRYSSPQSPVFVKGTKTNAAYEANKGLDFSGDGVITAYEATTPVRNIYNRAKNKPPILVDMVGPVDETTGEGVGVTLLFLLGIWTISRFTSRAKRT